MEYTHDNIMALVRKQQTMAEEYNTMMKELAQIRNRKAIEIIKLIDIHKTISKAEKYWAVTEDGMRETEIDLYSKGLVEIKRSIKTELNIIQAQSYNQL